MKYALPLSLLLWLLIVLSIPEAIERDKLDRLQMAREAVRAQMERDIEFVKTFGKYDHHRK